MSKRSEGIRRLAHVASIALALAWTAFVIVQVDDFGTVGEAILTALLGAVVAYAIPKILHRCYLWVSAGFSIDRAELPEGTPAANSPASRAQPVEPPDASPPGSAARTAYAIVALVALLAVIPAALFFAGKRGEARDAAAVAEVPLETVSAVSFRPVFATEDLDDASIKELETSTAALSTAQIEREEPDLILRSVEHSSSFVGNGPGRLAIVRYSVNGINREVDVQGRAGINIYRVLCISKVDREIDITGGPCGEEIAKIFLVRITKEGTTVPVSN